MSSIHPLVVLRCGDYWEFSGPLNDSNGQPLDLTNAQIIWKLDSLDQQTNYITLVLGMGVTVLDETKATVVYGPSKTQTASLAPGTYYDTLQVILADGVSAFTVVEGLINATPQPQ